MWVAVRWYRPGGSKSVDEIADQYLGVVLDGILPADSASRGSGFAGRGGDREFRIAGDLARRADDAAQRGPIAQMRVPHAPQLAARAENAGRFGKQMLRDPLADSAASEWNGG